MSVGRTPSAGLAARWAAAALLVAGPLAAQELTPRSLVESPGIREAALSPDGERVLVVSDRSGTTRLWVMDRDGGGARLLVADEGPESSPAWSPDGRTVAFLRSRDGQPDVWTVATEGGAPRRVTADAEGERALAWSPDGRRIAFLSDRAGAQDVHLVEVASGRVEQLTRDTNPWDEFRWAPEWSPDGRWIAYVSGRAGETADDLWLVDPASKETVRVTAGLHVMSTPVWSPDGRQVAFNAVREEEFWYGDMSDLYVVEMPGRRVRRVETGARASDRNGSVRMAWSADSRALYFRYEWQGDANLWAVPVEGGAATQMTYGIGDLGEFSASRDGRSIVYVRSTPTRAGEVHRFDLDGGPPRPLTDWIRPFAGIRAPEKVTYRSRDGRYILGYLFLPPDFDPGRRYPSLVQVHGGGNNAFGNGFHPLEHLLAGHGYVVLAIEYRGSAGHGREFQDLALGGWAADQGWDAVAAAEHLRSRPYSNGRVGIYGGSYGGIMTLAALTRDSSPFDAAAPWYGIYDWADAYRHGDRLMRFWIVEGHQGFRPDEDPERFARTATLRHLDRVRPEIPFLVIHGERDRRAPFQQSQRLVAALRERGNPVEFHSYPEEGHGFRLPENRLHAYSRLLAFFDEHLRSPGPRTQP